jgi:hypothetical protein
LKEFFSSIRKNNGGPNVVEDREMPSHTMEGHPPVEHDAQQFGSASRQIDEVQSKQSNSRDDAKNLGEEDPRRRLMMVDAAIEIMAIMKEASDVSSVLNPLKVACGVTIRVLEVARVSYECYRPDPH